MRINKFTCSICKKKKEYKSDSTTGYDVNDKNQKVCYECCAIGDKVKMILTGKIVLYLTVKFNGESKITNWPGSLIFNQPQISIGRHNWGLTRYDIWFVFNGFQWHGVRYGDNTQLCYCKQTKVVA